VGSYNIIVKTEEIRRRVQDGDFDSAQKILDTMVLKKVKNIADQSLFADVYTHNKRYDEAMELLYRVYKKSKTRRTLYQLLNASIGRKNIPEAEHFLKKYEKAAPNDFSIYIFRYKINKAKKEPYIILIDSLKKLKHYTYMEKWAYELAKLYYKAGMEKECIQECSDIILWFGEGSYVEKAKILKAYYSGEVDKDEIIEKLKNRASLKNKTSNNLGISNVGDDEDTPNVIVEDEEIAVTVKSEDEDVIEDSYMIENTYGENPEILRDVDSIRIKTHDEPEDIVLEELAKNVGNEVDIFMTSEQSESDDPQPEVELDIKSFIRTEERNENLERIDKLSESLCVDIYHIFGNFLHVKPLQKQLVKSLELIMNRHTKSVQMIITGPPSSGKTTLAKDIALFLNKAGKLKTSRIAKISAIKLNEIDIKKEELRNTCLVIENASELQKPTIDKVLELIKYFRGDIAVIFEENKKNMNRLFRECPKLMELFKNRIHLPGYTEKDLFGFAYSYIILRDYKLQPSALEILKDGVHKIIENSEKENKLEEISNYVQNAMTSADLRTGKQLPKFAAEGRLADIDILSLLPEDFTYKL